MLKKRSLKYNNKKDNLLQLIKFIKLAVINNENNDNINNEKSNNK